MKIYKCKRIHEIMLLILFSLPLMSLCLFFLFGESMSLNEMLLMNMALIFFLMAYIVISGMRLKLSDDYLEYIVPFQRKQSIKWSQIDKLTSLSIVYDNITIITLIPKDNSNVLSVKMALDLFPIETLKHLLSCLPQDADIQLSDYLKKRLALEGKMDPKSIRWIVFSIIITIILGSCVYFGVFDMLFKLYK